MTNKHGVLSFVGSVAHFKIWLYLMNRKNRNNE